MPMQVGSRHSYVGTLPLLATISDRIFSKLNTLEQRCLSYRLPVAVANHVPFALISCPPAFRNSALISPK